MPILFVVLLLAVLYPLLLAWDLRTMRNPETGEYKPRWVSDSLVMFAPFSLLFYHDHFWASLLYYFLPLLVYCLLVANLVKRWKKVSAAQEMIQINGVGSLLLTILAYYLFFHQGAVTEDAVAQPETEKSIWAWWPFVVIIFLGVLTSVISSEKLLLVVGLIFLLLPFFSHHPLWAMLVATISYLMMCFSLAKQQGNGAYVAVFFFYMLAQMLALIVYAIFF